MGFLTGLLSGFNESAEAGRKAARDDEDAQLKREMSMLGDLTNSADPEIAHAAVSAFAEIAAGSKRPKGGFLQRIVSGGPTTIHPAVQHVLNLMQTPVDVPGMPIRALGPVTGGTPPSAPATRIPNGVSAAMPATSAAEPGGGPSPTQLPSPTGGPPPLPVTRGIPSSALETGPTTSRAVMGKGGVLPSNQTQPRKIFLSPDEQAYKTRVATEQADVEGEIQGWMATGLSRGEAIEQVKGERLKRTGVGAQGTLQPTPGEDDQGHPMYAAYDKRPASPTYGKYIDPDTFEVIPNFRPRTATGSTSLGANLEAAARQLFGKPASQLTGNQMAQAQSLAQQMTQGTAFARGVGTGQAGAIKPLTPEERLTQERTLRADLTRYNQDARTALNMVNVVNTAYTAMKTNYEAGKPIGAQQQAIVQSFARILDTLSSVREAEYERTPEGQSLWNRFQGAIDRARQGGAGLAVEEIDNVVQLANQIAAGRQAYMRQQAATTRETVRSYGLNEANVITPDLVELLGDAAGGPPPVQPVITSQPRTGATPPPAAPTGGRGGAPPPTGAEPTIPTGTQVGNLPRMGDVYAGEVRQLADGRKMGNVNGVFVEVTTMDGGKTWHVLKVY